MSMVQQQQEPGQRGAIIALENTKTEGRGRRERETTRKKQKTNLRAPRSGGSGVDFHIIDRSPQSSSRPHARRVLLQRLGAVSDRPHEQLRSPALTTNSHRSLPCFCPKVIRIVVVMMSLHACVPGARLLFNERAGAGRCTPTKFSGANWGDRETSPSSLFPVQLTAIICSIILCWQPTTCKANPVWCATFYIM